MEAYHARRTCIESCELDSRVSSRCGRDTRHSSGFDGRNLQTKALEAQMKAVEAQNEVLKQTQYDRALAMIKSQRELFENERASLQKQVADLSTSGKDRSEEIAKLEQRISALDSFKRNVDEEKKRQEQSLSEMMQMLVLQMQRDGGKLRPPAP